jgi:hypothetical protein
MLLLFLSKNSRRVGNLAWFAAILVKFMVLDGDGQEMEYIESGKGYENIIMSCEYSENDKPGRAAVACATRTYLW